MNTVKTKFDNRTFFYTCKTLLKHLKKKILKCVRRLCYVFVLAIKQKKNGKSLNFQFNVLI